MHSIKMLITKFEILMVTVWVLPFLYAHHLPKNEKIETLNLNSQLPKIHENLRNARQNTGANYHNPHHHSANFLNLLNTHGVGLSADVGIGFRVASGDNHKSDHPNYTPKPSTNSVWDRYIGSSWHIGLNTHLGNNKQGQEGIVQHAGGGALPIVSTQEDDREKSDVETTTVVIRDDTFWERLTKYFMWNKSDERKCDENSETGEQVNCDQPNKNLLTKMFSKYFLRENSRDKPLQNRLLNETTNQDNLFTKISKYFDQLRNDERMDPRQITIMRNDFEEFKNTIRYYLVNRFTSYITQNTTNQQFLQKMVRSSLLEAMNGTETDNSKTDKTLIKSLSHYFSNEKIKNLFPDIEYLRSNIANTTINSENEYNSWFKNNLSKLISNHFSKNQ